MINKLISLEKNQVNFNFNKKLKKKETRKERVSDTQHKSV